VVGAKNGQFSPRRYDGGLGTGAGAPGFPSSTPVNVHSGPQGSAHNVVTGANYGGHQSSSVVNEELSVVLRGMAVEDDHDVQQTRQYQSVSHGAPPMPPRPYGAYPQADYNPYYAVPPRDPYTDFSYGYGPTDATIYPSPASPGSLYPPVGPQGMHLNTIPDIHRTQQGVFFDYGAAAHPVSQFYYPTHQPVMYPPPTHSPMTAPQVPATLADKKREMQVCH
jgi:hypothetical protein